MLTDKKNACAPARTRLRVCASADARGRLVSARVYMYVQASTCIVSIFMSMYSPVYPCVPLYTCACVAVYLLVLFTAVSDNFFAVASADLAASVSNVRRARQSAIKKEASRYFFAGRLKAPPQSNEMTRLCKQDVKPKCVQPQPHRSIYT